jgi:mannan endo-1,4-beta-mannosidase
MDKQSNGIQGTMWFIGEDIYRGPRAYSSQYSRFHGALRYTQANEIAALTENGTIPDPDLILRDEAVWAWFCTWEGEFMWKAAGEEKVHSGKHTELDMLRKVYSHSKVITRDKLPDLINCRL